MYKIITLTLCVLLSFPVWAKADLSDNDIRQLFMVNNNIKNPQTYGGVVLFQDFFDRVGTACQMKKAHPEMLVMVDEEGGEITRVQKYGMPSPREAIKFTPEKYAKEVSDYAKLMKKKCIDINLAPNLDRNTTSRSYGLDIQKTEQYAKIMIDEMRKNNILTIAKHYPGEGAGLNCVLITKNLSEVGISINPKGPLETSKCSVTSSEEYLKTMRLYPKTSADGLMINANIYPDFGPYPAFMSPRAVEFLRKDLGYGDRFIMSDAVWGLSLDKNHILQVLKNVDMVMMSYASNVEEMIPFIRQAIETKEISTDELRNKLRKIKELKAKLKP